MSDLKNLWEIEKRREFKHSQGSFDPVRAQQYWNQGELIPLDENMEWRISDNVIIHIHWAGDHFDAKAAFNLEYNYYPIDQPSERYTKEIACGCHVPEQIYKRAKLIYDMRKL